MELTYDQAVRNVGLPTKHNGEEGWVFAGFSDHGGKETRSRWILLAYRGPGEPNGCCDGRTWEEKWGYSEYGDDGKNFRLGTIRPGDRFAWCKENCEIEILNKTTSMDLQAFVATRDASPDQKLLKRHGIENPIGTPTPLGLELAAVLTYQDKREALVEILKAKEAEDKAAK